MRLDDSGFGRAARLMFALALVAAWSGAADVRRVHAADERPGPTDGSATPALVAPRQAAQDVARALAALTTLQSQIPRDSFDPKVIVESVGKDPQKLTDWVRAQTQWLPYRGVLRGARGVLMDRMGGGLDRALLLAALLTDAGHQVRLANAQLPDAAAERVLADVWTDRRATPATQPAATGTLFDALCRDAQMDAADARTRIDAARARNGVTVEAIAAAVQAQTPLLAAALAKGEPADERAAALAAARDHWWVRAKSGDAWVDLDILRDHREAPLANVRHFTPDQLRDDDHHIVQLSVVIEKWDDGKLTEHAVLQHAMRPAELIGQPVWVTHAPLDWPKDQRLADRGPAVAPPREQVMAPKRWAPALRAGGRVIVSKGFTDAGEIIDAPGAMLAGGGTVVGGRVEGLLSPRRPAVAKGQITAEFLDYEVRVPGAPAVKIRRPLVDLLGPHARAEGRAPQAPSEQQRYATGLTLLARTEVVLQNCRLSPHFLQDRMASVLLSARGDLNAAGECAINGSRPAPAVLANINAALDNMPGPATSLALARFAASPAAGNVYIDRPNVLNYRAGFAESQGRVLQTELFDIVTHDVGVLPGSDARATRSAQGLTDTAAEGQLVAGAADGQSGAVVAGDISTTQVFAMAAKDSIPAVTVRTEQDLAALKLTPDVRQRMLASLGDGCIVVAPREPATIGGRPRIAWWRVNPRTGATLGILDTGHHGAAVEKPATEKTNEELFMSIAPYINNGNLRAQQALVELTMRAGGGASMGLGVLELAAVIFASLAAGITALVSYARAPAPPAGGSPTPTPTPGP